MSVMLRRLGVGLIVIAPLLCASCLTMTMPKSARLEKPGAEDQSSTRTQTPPSDKRIVDTWELMFQEDDKGTKEVPRESTRTLLEFTDRGRIIFNRVDKDNTDRVKTRTGNFTLEDGEIKITDDVGNSGRWPYQITGEQLVIVMPEKNKKFHWRRFR
ncbi:MAG: lipocalin family protein [Deltaproteobacteria bacterium]|nr:lipocalin family protein [Deltaproteobacteria bacterium]